MKISIKAILNLLLRYIRNDYSLSPESWLVSCILSSIDMPESFFDSDSPTMDPAYWYDWKELVEEAVEEDKSIIDEVNGLTLEQGLVAIQYFLEQRYWVKNNNLLLKDAYEDLINELSKHKDNLESSRLWREWLAAIADGRKCDKSFKNG